MRRTAERGQEIASRINGWSSNFETFKVKQSKWLREGVVLFRDASGGQSDPEAV
jgi:hypothetical protein